MTIFNLPKHLSDEHLERAQAGISDAVERQDVGRLIHIGEELTNLVSTETDIRTAGTLYELTKLALDSAEDIQPGSTEPEQS